MCEPESVLSEFCRGWSHSSAAKATEYFDQGLQPAQPLIWIYLHEAPLKSEGLDEASQE